MDRRHYNRDDAYSRGGDRVDRYYEASQEGGRAGYGGDRYYESSQEGGRGGYGGDRYYEGSQEGGRAGYGGDRYYESSQEGGRAGYGGGDRYYRGEQDGGGRGVYGGDGGGRGGYGGDRYYGGAQDGGGRGGYGGGTGAGYHRRSVGRDRSYTHPYNNRHQEDQGGGRRRESGGGGGGSPSYRTPTYHRQISDQVQDRLGRHPEAIRSRSPVRVQDRLGRNPDAIRSPLRVQDRLEAVRSRSPLRVLDRLGRNPEAIRSPPRVLNRLGRDPEAIRSRSPLRVQDRLEAVRSRSPLRVLDRLGHNPETIRSPPRVLNRLGRDPEAIRSRSPRVQDRLGRDPEAIRSRSPLRVQDRLGRDPEAIRSPPQFGQLVNSRSRSQSQALTQPQNRIADRIQEVEEVQHREVQCVQSLMEDGEYGYAPMRRPDHGTLAMKSVKLLVNHFPVKFDPSTAILRYDVDIKHEMASSGRSMKKPIPKSDLRLIQEQLCTDDPDRFPIRHTAYDGEKNMYSAVSLPEGTYNVQLHGRSYTCTIKYGTKLGLSKLQDFLKGNSMHIPRDVLQALDVVMKANLYREKNSVGKGMYPRVHRKEDDLHGGVAAYRGSQQSLKVTSNGLVMCLDYSAVPFRKRMPVFDFLKECIQGIREVYDIERFGNQVIRALKGLKVGVTHRRTNQKYTVCGLSEKPTRDISFELEDLEGKKETEVIMLTDYFREKWGKEIKHKDMPCLNLGNNKKPNYVPMEFCILAEDKRFPKEQLGKEAARKLKELSLLNPNCREREIHTMVHEEYATGKNGAKLIKNFEVEVGMNLTEVDGRVMAPPQLKLGSLSGKTMTTTVDRMKCHWNLLQGKTLVVGKSAERWAVIDFTRDDRRNSLNVNYFIGKLMKRCESIGIQMEEPIMVHQTTMREFSDINKLTRLLNEIMDECRRIDNRRLQMIFCVMAEKHDGYKYLKWVSETQLGIITQCCLSFNANKANDQFLANLGMKINAKLGGSNVELIERFPLFNSSDHFMFIGADVNHPTGSNQSSPSVAAVVGSVNWPAATRYAARVSPQQHRKEEIVNFGSLCLDVVNTYELRNGIKPNRIVVFRDGVSDGQFDMVLNKEMVDMKKALYDDHYRPAVTFVVAQKRHTTRLFLNNGNGVGNIPPGTVVDTTIVQPFEFDFYLCSHFGGMGTSKPTHYSVIWDENGFTSDEIQKLIYHLCFIFARCTKPVSLVPPVYYADLVAYRGRMFQEVAAESELESGMSASEPSSFDRFFYNLEDHLRDSMFFI